MHTHGPSCLQGPITKERPWWKTARVARVRSLSREKRPIRTELVDRVRREIAQGQYDTPEKLEAALDRLFRNLESS